MKTHYAAVKDGIIVGDRSSSSRHVEGIGKFGPYTHAVYTKTRTTRTTTTDNVTSDAVSWSEEIQAWSGRADLAQQAIKHVRREHTYEYNGVKTTVLHTEVAIVPVIIVPKRPKIGTAVAGIDVQLGVR